MSNKRLLKEYRDIMNDKIECILTKPRENNILLWDYIINPIEEPYKDGYYHGTLEFDKDYPMKPPSIKMLTPSGRFQVNSRLCLSMSDYHPESWNPSWGVRTILIGLHSFMLSEEFSEGTVGSISDSFDNRILLKEKSLEYNRKNEFFVSLLEENLLIESKGQKDEVNRCRYCFEPGELIAPCKCIGSNKWVHKRCLAKWQYTSILSQSTHPKYQTDIERICNVCKGKFNIIEFSRNELMLQFTGKDIANMIKRGNYIVSSQKSSKYNTKLISENKSNTELVENIKHWTKSVLLITHCLEYGNEESIHAVNITRDITLSDYPTLYFNWQILKKYFDLHRIHPEFYIGGPCESNKCFGLLRFNHNCKNLLNFSEIDYSLFENGEEIILFSKIEIIIYLLNHYPNSFIYNNIGKIDVKIIWGIAGWSKTQLLGEIAKGSWGICRSYINEIMDKTPLWEKLIKSSRPIYCGINDFSEKYACE